MKIDDKVLDFYSSLPFNTYEDPEVAIKNIKEFNIKKTYPFLHEDLLKCKKIVDIGCGGGWLANVIAYHYKKDVVGIDFNPEAIKHAEKISNKLKNNNKFIVENIFNIDENLKFDLILSMGVLHHTRDCLKALDKVCKIGEKNSKIFIGLYHKYGREAFLKKFDSIKNDEDKLSFYKEIHPLKDNKHQMSWFRDQVLHPHETQHTLDEVIKIYEINNYKFTGTSINNFEDNLDLEKLRIKEKKLLDVGIKRLDEKRYYPGFFIVSGEKNGL